MCGPLARRRGLPLIRGAYYWIGAELFPEGSIFTPDPDDVMLVSYPKSGNTWVRALVANLVGIRQSLREMDNLVPDIYASRGPVIRNAYRFPCSGRLIKSHESFNASYKRVIHVVRDPRDVCVSYYHYRGDILREFDRDTTSLNEFVDKFVAGSLDNYGTWGEHTNSWFAAEAADLLFLRYEDLLADTPRCFARICDFLGLEADSSEIVTAVENCSLERLRAKEESEGTLWHPVRKAKGAVSFFRKGGSASRTDLDHTALQQICDKWRDPMERLGYLNS